MPPRRAAPGSLVLVLVALAACSGAAVRVRRAAEQGDIVTALRQYDRYATERGDGSPELLADVALAVLRKAAGSADPAERAAGFAALRGLASHARDTYELLARRPGVVGDRAAAELYELDGRSGDPPPRLAAALASDDPERRVAGLARYTDRDVAALLRLVDDPQPAVRRAVVRRLARCRNSAEALAALTRVARTAPDAGLRATAVMALGSHGVAAEEALAGALNDPDGMVRMAVPGALTAASTEAAQELLAPLLEGEATDLALESARVLATRRDARAARYLVDALRDPRPAIRVQAAVGAGMLGEEHADALAPSLDHDDAEVALRIAASLVRREGHRARAAAVLRRLGAQPDGFVAIRALAALAATGDGSVGEAIRGALSSSDATVRRLAVLAWGDAVGASGNADALAPLLLDPDRTVALLAAAQVIHVALR